MGFFDRITSFSGGRDPDLLDGNFDRRSRPPKAPKEPSPPVDPKRLQPNEIRTGYVVAAILIVAAVLNMAVTTGKGAPKNPPYLLSAIGIVLALAMIGLMLAHRRMLAPFAAVAAAFCVTFPKTPDSLVGVHLLAIIAPVIWAFWLTQRTNKAIRAERVEAAKAKRDARQASGRQGGGRGRRKEAEPPGPAANRRYTPPKTKPKSQSTPAARGSAKSGPTKADGDAEPARNRFRRLSRGTG